MTERNTGQGQGLPRDPVPSDLDPEIPDNFAYGDPLDESFYPAEPIDELPPDSTDLAPSPSPDSANTPETSPSLGLDDPLPSEGSIQITEAMYREYVRRYPDRVPVVNWSFHHDQLNHLGVLKPWVRDNSDAKTVKDLLDIFYEAYLESLKRQGPSQTGPVVYSGDLDRSNLSAFKELEKMAGNGNGDHGSESTDASEAEQVKTAPFTLVGLHGGVSHRAIAALIAGHLPNREAWLERLEAEDKVVQQRYQDEAARLGTLVEIPDPSSERAQIILPDNSVHPDWLARIKHSRAEILEAINAGDVAQAQVLTRELVALLDPIFGRHVHRLDLEVGDFAHKLMVPTMLNWAAAVLAKFDEGINLVTGEKVEKLADRHEPLFTEVEMLHEAHRLRGNRADALRVIRIGDRAPTERERQILWTLAPREGFKKAKRVGYKSMEGLARLLAQKFDAPVRLAIVDFKFDIGDNVKSLGPITPEMIAEGPMEKHDDQMMRYLTVGAVDAHLPTTGPSMGNEWPQDSPVEYADLLYFLHSNALPTRFRITQTPEQLHQFFVDRIVKNLGVGYRRAQDRQTSNAVLRPIITRAQRGEPITTPRKRKDIAEQLWLMGPEESRFDAFADAHRNYIDPERVIEHAGTKRGGKPIYNLHYGHLSAAIKSGAIRTASPGSSLLKVTCPFPQHNDPNPSFYVQHDGGFHCFGCGRRGDVLPNSYPKNMRDLPKGREAVRLRRVRVQRLEDVAEIPEAHTRAMRDLQDVLAQQMRAKGSPGRRYLESRGIDVDLAMQYGAGYAPSGAIMRGMYARGWSIEQLLHYGIFLRTKDDRVFSALDRRVTFPLTLKGRNTSVYGRSTVPKPKIKHFKLSRAFTGVPHGMFNEEATETPGEREVIVVESILDALSLIQMGHPNVVAIIGVSNHISLDRIVQSGRPIAIALNNDRPGYEATAKIRRRVLPELGYSGRARRFTREFVRAHPEIRGIDDYNAMLDILGASIRPPARQ